MAITRKQKNGKTGGTPGRPRNVYTPDQERAIEQAARVNCTYEEIADISGIPRATLARDFGQTIEKIRVNAKESLRRAQFKAAIEGNPTMLIWLGKQWLKQKDKHEHSGPDEGPINVSVSKDEDKAMLDAIKEVGSGIIAAYRDRDANAYGIGGADTTSTDSGMDSDTTD